MHRSETAFHSNDSQPLSRASLICYKIGTPPRAVLRAIDRGFDRSAPEGISMIVVRVGCRSFVLLVALAILSLVIARPVSADNTATQEILPPARVAETSAPAQGG